MLCKSIFILCLTILLGTCFVHAEPLQINQILLDAEKGLGIKLSRFPLNYSHPGIEYHPAYLEVPLKSGHKLCGVTPEPYNLSGGVGNSLILDIDSANGTWRQIKTVQDLTSIVQLNTTKDAIEYVNYITAGFGRMFLKTDYFRGMEINGKTIFVCDKSAQPLWESASIEEQDGIFVIERDLIIRQSSGSALVRSHETVTKEGLYTFEFKIKKTFMKDYGNEVCSPLA